MCGKEPFALGVEGGSVALGRGCSWPVLAPESSLGCWGGRQGALLWGTLREGWVLQQKYQLQNKGPGLNKVT